MSIRSILLVLAVLLNNDKLGTNAQTLDFKEYQDFFEIMNKIYVVTNDSNVSKRDFSVPGTKWCGPGNTADGYDDLGYEKETDKCCRAHDNCDAISAGEEKYGLKNDGFFTRLHCKCDKEFRQCLKSVNSSFSNSLGTFYFIVQNQCYNNQHPVLNCDIMHYGFFIRRCCKYEVDKTKQKAYQWFDLPFYNDEHEFEVESR